MANKLLSAPSRLTKAPKRVLGRLREVSVNMGAFPVTVWVVIGPLADLSAYLAWRRPGSNVPDSGCFGCCWPDLPAEIGPVIWLRSLATRHPGELGALAHEATHAGFSICTSLGVPLSDETHEPLCYCVSHIVKTVLKELKR